MKRSITRRSRHQGFTLIEMLVALAVTLIMMGSVVTLFGVITESVSGARAGLEMSDRLRAARDVVQSDLQGATATMVPPIRPEDDAGYFEIIEGPANDHDALVGEDGTLNTPDDNLLLFGDNDDILMFTTRSSSAPFVGRLLNQPVLESQVAEVIYFVVRNGPIFDARQNPPTRLATLYRRVLLVAPSTPMPTVIDNAHVAFNDVSVRFVNGATPKLVANTLGDLTKRENRFAHGPKSATVDFPFPAVMTRTPLYDPAGTPNTPTWPAQRPKVNALIGPMGDNNPPNTARLGEDILLTNVLSFDVQVWDPTAQVRVTSGVALEPRDPGWAASGTNAAVGAFVDLGYGQTVTPETAFSKVNPRQKPASSFDAPPVVPATQAQRVYDTWSMHYEANGVDEDTTDALPADSFTNGMDDGGQAGIVDDPDERDTRPPYQSPVRGIRITIRVYEPSSQQIKESVIVQDFSTK